MAVVPSAWTKKTENGKSVFTCTVLADAAIEDAGTLITPRELDTNRPYTLIYSAATTPDAQALPLKMFITFDPLFAFTKLQGNPNEWTGTGAEYIQLCDDVVLAVAALPYVFSIIPSHKQTVANVVTAAAKATGLKVGVPPAPYHAFNLDGGSTLAAVVSTYTIIQ